MRSQAFFLVLLVFLILAPRAWGGMDCDCVQVSHADLIAHSELIFLGTVESVRDSVIVIAPASHGHERVIHRRAASVRMRSVWKGSPRKHLTVFGLPKGYCNGWRSLEREQTYLIFADSTSTGWSLAECGGPAPSSESLSWIEGLGKSTNVQSGPSPKPVSN